MSSMDLVEFLNARLDEDEQAAREAGLRPWFSTDNYLDDANGGDVARFEIKADARHAGRHDPAHVLADVTAKRQLVVALAGYLPADMHFLDDVTASRAHVALLGLTHLALPYADHPDYREEWRP